jgi:ABC-type transport system involved in multi-copper enzyme maturation permease subunit
MRPVLRRELALVLRARVTWLQAGLAALLIGHGFVLALDLFSAGSRSAQAGTLMAREFDPLLGIVRPCLGGLYVALSLFAPLLAARCLAIEKDRQTLHTLTLETGSVLRLVLRKWVASLVGVVLPWGATVGLLALWGALRGHLAGAETAIALSGYALYAAFAASIGLAAAAFARNFAQAATAALVAIAATLAIDAADGFSALAWLGGAAAWSPTTYLRPFEEGTLALGAAGWFAGATAGLLGLAYVGCRFDLHGRRRSAAILAAGLALVLAASLGRRLPGAWDLTELARHSLPPAAARELRALPGTLEIVANLDREDSRRRQLESETLAKLRLARPDLRLRWPPDERRAPGAVEQDAAYGRLTIRLGNKSVETTSTSRREIVTLIFGLAGRPLPDWTQPEYPGYPLVVEGNARTFAMIVAYGALPTLFLIIGTAIIRTRRRTT